MSHGSSGGDDTSADPNLTPLLDLVMQLLMFFIVCANLKSADKERILGLPTSTSPAAVIETNDDDEHALVVSLTLKPFRAEDFVNRFDADTLAKLTNKFAPPDKRDDDGKPLVRNCVLIYNMKTNKRIDPQLLNDIDLPLREIYNDTEKLTSATALVRAEGEVDYGDVIRLMQMCEAQKYKVLDRTRKVLGKKS
jgi:biopolymer transport protein ExbD